MTLGPDKLWLIPLLPLLAAGVLAITSNRVIARFCSLAAIILAFVLSLAAFAGTLHEHRPQVWNFEWIHFGTASLQLGFVLDPLSALMLVMVTFIATLVFIYSTGYMAHDENFAKFFCFLSLFAAGMLGVVIANSLLLLFMCWEIVGLASYLLIGFWYFKPAAAAAAKKAFITTRIGDIAFFLGMIWLYAQTGTLLFYDNGKGCMEPDALNLLVTRGTMVGISAATAIALLIFLGAMGKSGQVPLHVWLPDAMEGPTPVSALIHAATMVAAGVFLVARVYPLMDADIFNLPGMSRALTVVTWGGAITALFGASVAVAQDDLKRILAYSTVSQLGYMMLGLGAGGVFVGMFHLLTHAFFKALLFLGAGSVIHGLDGEQDIRRMGGLRRAMPVTFGTYAVGMMALAGVPLFFSGFWSKDEILYSALHWPVSKLPFLAGVAGAFLTAFYMTRQMIYVFFGESRGDVHAHESPPAMTVPLVILGACAVLAGFFGTPAWPWLESYMTGGHEGGGVGRLFSSNFLPVAALSTAAVGAGIFGGWFLYLRSASARDPLEARVPELFDLLRRRLWFDEAYAATAISLNTWISKSIARVETVLFAAAGWVIGLAGVALGWLARVLDLFVIDGGFDSACESLRSGARNSRRFQGGRIQNYIQTIALTVALLALLLFLWGCKGP